MVVVFDDTVYAIVVQRVGFDERALHPIEIGIRFIVYGKTLRKGAHPQLPISINTDVGHIVRVHSVVGRKVSTEKRFWNTLVDIHPEHTRCVGREQYIVAVVRRDNLGNTYIGQHLLIVYHLLRIFLESIDALILTANQ